MVALLSYSWCILNFIFRNMSVENMQYLSSEQALADLASFITFKKSTMSLNSNKWIAFGGSYPGTVHSAQRNRVLVARLTPSNFSSTVQMLVRLDPSTLHCRGSGCLGPTEISSSRSCIGCDQCSSLCSAEFSRFQRNSQHPNTRAFSVLQSARVLCPRQSCQHHVYQPRRRMIMVFPCTGCLTGYNIHWGGGASHLACPQASASELDESHTPSMYNSSEPTQLAQLR